MKKSLVFISVFALCVAFTFADVPKTESGDSSYSEIALAKKTKNRNTKGKKMRLITIEEHITSSEILKDSQEYQRRNGSSSQVSQTYGSNSFVEDILTDVEKRRIPYMNEENIDMQILSYINPMDSAEIPNDVRTETSIKANNYLKSVVDSHPDRFAAFATLPLWDVDASVKELERTVKELNFKGALVTGIVDGHFLDEKQFVPLFAKAAELGVPIYFHPATPASEIMNYYYKSNEGNWSDGVALRFGSFAFGWHIDIGIQMVRMILSGVFDKYPNLTLITGHWGEGMISMLDRLDNILPKNVTGLKKSISDYYRENIYITPSGINSQINLEATAKYLGADRIIWSVDYPYVTDKGFTNFLMNGSLTDEEKELISHKNAERLFKM